MRDAERSEASRIARLSDRNIGYSPLYAPPCSTERTAFEKVVHLSVRTFYHIWYVIPYMIRWVLGGTNSFKWTPIWGNFRAIVKSRHWQRKDTFWGRGIERNHAEMQNTLIEKKDNRFWSLGGGHTALLSYHSHREYFKAPNCENSAVFWGFQAGFFPSFFVATVGGSIELGAFDNGARSIELHVRFDFRRRENSALDWRCCSID